jgi:hypothetical protein
MPDRLVPRDSATYQEFDRLHRIARMLRPTGIDHWSGDLYATDDELWGGFSPKTRDVRLSEASVLRHLTGSTSSTDRSEQAEALATVLHESTHAGMDIDAPAQPNAVRSVHSKGLTEGIAEIRALEDFEPFTDMAGYPHLVIPQPKHPGAYAATESLIDQVTGPHVTPGALIDDATRGPVVMQFDQFADAVVRNRLSQVVPNRDRDQLAVRAALIQAMRHDLWPILPDRPAHAGESVAGEIRQHLDAKVDEIRRHYRYDARRPFPAEPPNTAARRLPDLPAVQAAGDALRFLSGQAPAAEAMRTRPVLGDGARGSGNPATASSITSRRSTDRGRD